MPVERRRESLRLPGNATAWLAVAMAAVFVVAIVGTGLVPSFGAVGGGSPMFSPSPSPTPTPTPTPTPPPTPTNSPTAATAPDPSEPYSIRADGMPFSVRLPAPYAGNGWEVYGDLLVSKSIAGPQGAEGVVYWAGFPDGADADPCINAPIERWSPATVADYIASAPGTELVTAPQAVTVGGLPATYVEVVVRDDRAGCDPGFFYNWKAQTGGAMWAKALPGDTVRVWLVVVADRLLFIAGMTHRELSPGTAITDAGRARLEQEIQQIVDSIRFE
jgi:hypothetical protein